MKSRKQIYAEAIEWALKQALVQELKRKKQVPGQPDIKMSVTNAPYRIPEPGDDFMQKTITIHHGEILTWPTTPILALAPPGANRVNLILSAVLSSHISVPYTGLDADASYIGVDYGNDAFQPTALFANDTTSSVADLTDLLTTPGKIYQLVPAHAPEPLLDWTTRPIDLGSLTSSPSVLNSSIYWFCKNLGGNLADGDPANFIRATVVYVPVEL